MRTKFAVRAVVPIVFALVITAVLGVFAATGATAGPARACAYDRPCIDELYFSTRTNRINVTWTSNGYGVDFYHVRWSVNRGGSIISFGQHEVRGTPLAKLNVGQGDRNNRFRVSIQQCAEHFLAPSSCSPWTTATIVPVPG